MKRNSSYRIMSLCLILVMLLGIIEVQPVQVQAKAKSKKYLLIVDNDDGSYEAYQTLTASSASGYAMLRAYDFSAYLGFTYKRSGNGFSISLGDKTVSFTKNSKNYTYTNGSKKTVKKLPIAPYTAKKDDIFEASNVVHYSALENLINMKFFPVSKLPEFQNEMYDGYIVMSAYSKIKSMPKKESIFSSSSYRMFDDCKHDINIADNYKEKTTTIGGIEVPTVNGYMKPMDCGEGFFGYDNMEFSLYYDSLMKEFCPYINNYMEATGYDLIEGSSPVLYLEDFLRFSLWADYNRPTFYFKKVFNHYELTMLTRFGGENYHYLDEVKENCVKFCLAAVTDQIDVVFDAIMNSYEGDESCGINIDTWTTIGNTKIKVALVNKKVVYYIKSAK